MGYRILFVDDDATLLRGICRSLDEAFDIETALSGEEALDVLSKQELFDCIVSDMKMPKMDGVELVSRIKASWPELPCIILTGNQDEDTLIRAREVAKVFCLLNKPCPRAELLGAIENAVNAAR